MRRARWSPGGSIVSRRQCTTRMPFPQRPSGVTASRAHASVLLGIPFIAEFEMTAPLAPRPEEPRPVRKRSRKADLTDTMPAADEGPAPVYGEARQVSPRRTALKREVSAIALLLA